MEIVGVVALLLALAVFAGLTGSSRPKTREEVMPWEYRQTRVGDDWYRRQQYRY